MKKTLMELEIKFPKVSLEAFKDRCHKLIDKYKGYSLAYADVYRSVDGFLEKLYSLDDDTVRDFSVDGFGVFRFEKKTDTFHSIVKFDLWHLLHETDDDFNRHLSSIKKKEVA